MARQASPILSMIIGVLGIAFAGYMYVSQSTFIKKSVETEGTVVEIDKTRKRSKDTHHFSYTYRPVISYVAWNSNFRFKSYDGSSYSENCQVGQKIAVLYNRENPSDAQIKTKADYRVSIIAGLAGLAALGYGIFMRKKAASV
ncbi:MAG TPA: DUF3592 domain-containing protein [Spirochaetota bacterium]|nr:DUF3592 domain-containing protein [Spirochaetota bacterium]